MVISILVGIVLFINGVLVGWSWDEIKDDDDCISSSIILALAGSIGLVLYGIGVLISKLWKWIKSL